MSSRVSEVPFYCGHNFWNFGTPGTFWSQKKSSAYTARGLKSGRPGSNRPPRPWQGRALPNELLPRDITDYTDYIPRNPRYKELKGCKNKHCFTPKKIFRGLFVFGRVQSIIRNRNIRLACISFCIEHITAT
jgi:hypothetical protein